MEMNQEENELSSIAFNEVDKLRRQVFRAESDIRKIHKKEEKCKNHKKEIQTRLQNDEESLESRIKDLEGKRKEQELFFSEFLEDLKKLKHSEDRVKAIQNEVGELEKMELRFERRNDLARAKFGAEKNKPKFSNPSTKFEQQLDLLVNNFNSLRAENKKARKALEEVVRSHILIKEDVENKESVCANEQRIVDRLIERASDLLVEREENVAKSRVFSERLRIIVSKHTKDTSEAKRRMSEQRQHQEYTALKKKLRGKQEGGKVKGETNIVEAQSDATKWNDYFIKMESKNILQILTLVKSVLNDNVALFQNLGQFNFEIQLRCEASKAPVDTKELDGTLKERNVAKSNFNDITKYLNDLWKLLEIRERRDPGSGLIPTFRMIEESISNLLS